MATIGVGTFSVTQRMRELVNQVLDGGRITYGPMSAKFEQQFAELHGSRFAVLSNSGTSSLHVAVQALKEMHGWQDGDEVLVPAITFVASVNVLLHNRLTPVLVDVDSRHYQINPVRIERAITPRTRAIMPVHVFGQPCEMTAIMGIARQHNLSIIEDSCEAMFVKHKGKPVGSFGEVSCFSTYAAHLITTGVGGIAMTNDTELAVRMRSLVNHGRDGIYISIDDDDRIGKDRLHEVVSKRFHFEHVGHSFRITELEAALGLAQLETYQKMLLRRRGHAAYLRDHLGHLSDVLQLPCEREPGGHAWMMYPIVLERESKWGLVNRLESHGIETREMLPLTDQPCYAGLWNEGDYPIASWINRSGFYVGCHQDLGLKDMECIADTIGAYFGRPRVSASHELAAETTG